MFRILIVLCLAAASFGAAAQEPPGELAPQQDLYLIVLQPDQRGEPPFDPSSFGGRLEHRKGSRLAVRMTAEAAAAVEQNPRVRTIQLITLGRTDRPEGARAGARVIAHGNDSLTGGIYTYDGSGNIRSIGPNGDGGTDQFTYDEFGRLASAKVHSGGMPYLESYGYDGAGNLTQLVKPNLTINLPVEAATNRLSSSLGVAYDDTGHLTQSPVGSYEYDQVGMMSGTSEGRTYIYTASGERILIVPTSGGGLWRWTLRDLAGRKVREYESEREDFFLWLEDDYHDGQRLIASQRETAEGGRRHYHPDHLGTPRLITNTGGQRISTHDYYPYGVEITSIHQEAARGYGREQTAQFTGHERDDMASNMNQHSVYLDYMHARFYNPNWGRFLSPDPGRDWNPAVPQSFNLFSYVRNNPVNNTDPNGLWTVSLSLSFSKSAVGKHGSIKIGIAADDDGNLALFHSQAGGAKAMATVRQWSADLGVDFGVDDTVHDLEGTNPVIGAGGGALGALSAEIGIENGGVSSVGLAIGVGGGAEAHAAAEKTVIWGSVNMFEFGRGAGEFLNKALHQAMKQATTPPPLEATPEEDEEKERKPYEEWEFVP